MSWYRWDGEDLLLWVRVQPRASRDGFAEVVGDAIKVRITAPPVDGKANTHLTTWLARQFRVAKSAIQIESGETSRRKRVRICEPVQIPPALSEKMRV
ncbi:MAG: YggU family protein [Gammaproteobacteria bacterium]|nr:MAG: YggU family protein [Gammaproteobacteria bacterium]